MLQQSHSMHLHEHHMVVVFTNGHAIPPVRGTTQTISPGDFSEIEFRAEDPSNRVFHCHVPHHITRRDRDRRISYSM